MDLRPLRPTVNSAAADPIFRVILKLSSIQKMVNLKLFYLKKR